MLARGNGMGNILTGVQSRRGSSWTWCSHRSSPMTIIGAVSRHLQRVCLHSQYQPGVCCGLEPSTNSLVVSYEKYRLLVLCAVNPLVRKTYPTEVSKLACAVLVQRSSWWPWAHGQMVWTKACASALADMVRAKAYPMAFTKMGRGQAYPDSGDPGALAKMWRVSRSSFQRWPGFSYPNMQVQRPPTQHAAVLGAKC